VTRVAEDRAAIGATMDGMSPAVLLARPVVASGVLLLTWIVTHLARRVLRRLVRRVAARSVTRANSFWRVRVQRVFGETPDLAEKRRRQRIDAISKMAAHLFSLCAWVVAFVVVLHVMQADVVPVLTSAGFIGAGLAIGGQHAVKDFIAGVGILVEDRFGVGDRIVVETPTGRDVEGVVECVGAFSTRLSSGDSTFHFSNGKLEHVRNLSQNPVTTAIRVPLPDHSHPDEHERVADAVAFAVSQAAGDRSLTGMVLVDEVRTAVRTSSDGAPHLAVEVRTAQPLTGTQADRLHHVAAGACPRPADEARR
jgi:small conductance mechanosensitive channel